MNEILLCCGIRFAEGLLLNILILFQTNAEKSHELKKLMRS